MESTITNCEVKADSASSGLPPEEAPIVIAEKHIYILCNLFFFSFLFLSDSADSWP